MIYYEDSDVVRLLEWYRKFLLSYKFYGSDSSYHVDKMKLKICCTSSDDDVDRYYFSFRPFKNDLRTNTLYYVQIELRDSVRKSTWIKTVILGYFTKESEDCYVGINIIDREDKNMIDLRMMDFCLLTGIGSRLRERHNFENIPYADLLRCEVL